MSECDPESRGNAAMRVDSQRGPRTHVIKAEYLLVMSDGSYDVGYLELNQSAIGSGR